MEEYREEVTDRARLVELDGDGASGVGRGGGRDDEARAGAGEAGGAAAAVDLIQPILLRRPLLLCSNTQAG